MDNEIRIKIADMCISIDIDNVFVRNFYLERLKNFLTKSSPDAFIKVRYKNRCNQKIIKAYSKITNPFIIEKNNKLFYYNFGVKIAVLDFKNYSLNLRMSLPYKVPLNLFLSSILFMKGIVSIHACGIINNDLAFIFVGESGSGKTTIANLCKDRKIISDERILIKKVKDKFYVFNLPYFGKENNPYSTPHKVILRKIFFIEKSNANYIYPEKKSSAFIELKKNCFFLKMCYSNFIIKRIFKVLNEVAQYHDCCRLGFKINSHIFKNKKSMIYE